VLNLKKAIASLARNRAKWDALMRAAKGAHPQTSGSAVTRLEEVQGFGSNPGNLRMFTYLPPALAGEPALVVILHGCTQTAAGYDHGAGWSTIADRYGFALLLPEQQRSNNPNGCFNWFQAGDLERGQGEALSIRQMVETMVTSHGIDRRRVFVTGLSAGGAMTSVMLACYPEVFAGGAIIAGLPYGAATNVQQAFESMFQSPARSARTWGDCVRGASRHEGPWPRISVWHGNADTTVIPSNAREILKQWTDVHGLPPTPSVRAVVDGYPREVWVNEAHDELIESYTILNMPHGTPLAMGEADNQCGAAGPFLLEVGISSSYHIAKFFGLTEPGVRHVPSTPGEMVSIAPQESHVGVPAEEPAQPHVLEGEVLGKEFEMKPERPYVPPSSGIDIGAVITKALTAAGLMKGR
jgi:poly(hydroxyalkanoate) depolymerase family esterase